MSPLQPLSAGTLDFRFAAQRVLSDLRTDFVPAPHIEALFRHGHAELAAHAEQAVAGGNFDPQLPIVMDVPKRYALTRPGAILHPIDRLVYQAVADALAQSVEAQTDRTRVFSHVLRDPDPGYLMFEARGTSYRRLTEALRASVEAFPTGWAIRADVANYYERLPQHVLVNLLEAAGCDLAVTRFLERMLSSWSERRSYGLPQGMRPSDLLGNFFLTSLDAHYDVIGTPTMRFVDDLYVFVPDWKGAWEGMVDLIAVLRKDGLQLNEGKSHILPAKSLIREETRLDRLFTGAHSEAHSLHGEHAEYVIGEAVAQGTLDPDAAEELRAQVQKEVDTKALERLWDARKGEKAVLGERIERFSLPLLAEAGSSNAVTDVIDQLPRRPHMARAYCRYLSRFAKTDPAVVEAIEAAFVNPSVQSDYLFSETSLALYMAPSVSQAAIRAAMRMVKDLRVSQVVRALSSLVVARHGTAAQRHNLRNHFADEPSSYVRLALVYASRYFPEQERATCLRAWGAQDDLSAIMAGVVKRLP